MNQLEREELADERYGDGENHGIRPELVPQGDEECDGRAATERRCAQCCQPIEGPAGKKYCGDRCRQDSANERDKEKRRSDPDDARPARRAAELRQIDWFGGPLELEFKPPAEPEELTKAKIAELETLIVEAGRLIRSCRPPLWKGRAAFAKFVEGLEMATRCRVSALLEIADFSDRKDAAEKEFKAFQRESLAPVHHFRNDVDSVEDANS